MTTSIGMSSSCSTLTGQNLNKKVGPHGSNPQHQHQTQFLQHPTSGTGISQSHTLNLPSNVPPNPVPKPVHDDKKSMIKTIRERNLRLNKMNIELENEMRNWKEKRVEMELKLGRNNNSSHHNIDNKVVSSDL